jgi:hypothetical protein
VALAGALPAAAPASVTIGQLAPSFPPPAECVGGTFDNVQGNLATGNSYVVPPGGAAITSWSTNAAAGAGQMLKLKVFRKIAEPATYMAVGHDGPRLLAPAAINTFPTHIPVQPGDVLGINSLNANQVPNACDFETFNPADTEPYLAGDLPDGSSAAFETAGISQLRVNATAVVGFKPSNEFSFGKLKRNESRGTATLAVQVPGPGSLSLTGTGIKAQRSADAGAAVSRKTVAEAGTVILRIKAKGRKKRKLNETGQVRVRAKVTYTPDGTATGDVIGDPNPESRRVKLLKDG